MKTFIKHLKTLSLCGVSLLVVAVSSLAIVARVSAVQGFSMTPMKENIILTPGEVFTSTFTIANPDTNDQDFPYSVEVSPFFVDEDYSHIYTAEGTYNEIVDWIVINSPTTGVLAPNESRDISYTIYTPSNAPAGGQYAAIVVSSDNAISTGNDSAILERTAIAHTIFAEITGRTVRQGEITDANVPTFLLSGDISGESTVKNTGNVHGTATYTLKVTPLFSSEEAFTNAESPDTHDVLPDRSYYQKTTWEGTPAVGIFNVVYTVEFEGVTTEVSKLVFKCPVWLMLLVVIVVVALIAWGVMIAKRRR